MNYTCHLFKNKFFQFEFHKFECRKIFGFNAEWTVQGEHCGPRIEIEFLSLLMRIKVYDCRHWNWKENRFYLDNELIFDDDIKYDENYFESEFGTGEQSSYVVKTKVRTSGIKGK